MPIIVPAILLAIVAIATLALTVTVSWQHRVGERFVEACRAVEAAATVTSTPASRPATRELQAA